MCETLPLPKAEGMLRELQLATLKMMKKFDKVARENGIKYTLGAGSAIGAIVHKGFIPWDDDIDVLMDRENFEKFLSLKDKILPEEILYKDYFTDQSMKVLLGKLIDKSTTMTTVDQYGRKTTSGVAIDISVFDKVPNGKIARRLQWLQSVKALILVNGIAPQNHGKIVNLYGKFALKTTKNKLKKVTKLTEKIKKYRYKDCNSVAEMLYLGGNRVYLDKQMFEEYIDVEFEDATLMITAKYDYYLRTRYQRDYTVLPPKEKRISWHNCEFLDTTIGYEEYLKRENGEI